MDMYMAMTTLKTQAHCLKSFMMTIEKLQKFGQLQMALQIDIFKEHIFRQTFK